MRNGIPSRRAGEALDVPRTLLMREVSSAPCGPSNAKSVGCAAHGT